MDQPPLTKSLRAASRKVHDMSDAMVNARMIGLFAEPRLWARALGCFWHVFNTLETALASCASHETLPGSAMPGNAIRPFTALLFTQDGLFRSQAFQQDLEYFLGPSWQQQCQPSQAVVTYQEHLQHLAATDPILLLAHSYTQHLAVASGGQIIRRLARKQMGLPEDQGTAAFEFKTSSTLLKHKFCTLLDQLGEAISPSVKQKMIEEHVAAFGYNNAIIRTFNIGWSPFLRGVVGLMPTSARVSIMFIVVCTVAVTAYRLGTLPVIASKT